LTDEVTISLIFYSKLKAVVLFVNLSKLTLVLFPQLTDMFLGLVLLIFELGLQNLKLALRVVIAV
jgi:hypothetical protein